MNVLPSSRSGRLALGLGVVVLAYAGTVGGYHLAYHGRVFPGVFLETTDLGGKSEAVLATEGPALLREHSTDRAGSVTVAEPNGPGRLNLALEAFTSLDHASLWAEASRQGRSPGDPSTYAPFLLRWQPRRLSPQRILRVDESRLRETLEEAAGRLGWNEGPRPAAFTFTPNAEHPERLDVTVEGARPGKRLDLPETAAAVQDGLFTDPQAPVPAVFLPEETPAMAKSELEPLLERVRRWVSGPANVAFEGIPTPIPASRIASWIEPHRDPETGALVPHLNRERMAAFLATLPLQTAAPKDGLLEVDAENRITELVLPTRGQTLDTEETIKQFEASLETPTRTAQASIVSRYGQFTGSGAERLGIRDFLGRGHSNFSGSPGNRRKNIALGGNKVHQSLVAPNEDFSLLKALGTIDATHGWLPELVIKGNKTTPEYGGGLCQIGTTVFRAALNAGMPITERRNHSYRVRYYEPAGTDATIYDPAPDFKFKNDTPNWLLITQEAKTDDIDFLMWGTKDGRVASSSTPVVTNIVAPPPTKIVETTEIPVGTRKCTEVAHAGATASFDYAVRYADGRLATTTFRSVYRPWQAVCLVGVAQVTPAQADALDETPLAP